MKIKEFLNEHKVVPFRERQRNILRIKKALAKATSWQDKADLYEQIILMHYYRSLEIFPDSHPPFETYAAHWIMASKELSSEQIIFDILQKKHPLNEKQKISKGSTFWGI